MTDSPNGGLSTAGDTGAGARTRPTPENSREPPDLPLRPEQHAPRGVGVKDLRPLRGRPSGPIPDPNASTRRAPETGGRNAKRKDQEQERRLTGPAPSGMTPRHAPATPLPAWVENPQVTPGQLTQVQVGSSRLEDHARSRFAPGSAVKGIEYRVRIDSCTRRSTRLRAAPQRRGRQPAAGRPAPTTSTSVHYNGRRPHRALSHLPRRPIIPPRILTIGSGADRSLEG